MKIISDKAVNKLLDGLSAEDVKHYAATLEQSLQNYSKNPTIIPPRIKKDSHLFMPAIDQQVGVKTLCGSAEGFKGCVLIIDPKNGDLQGVLNAFTLTAFRTALCSIIPLIRVFDYNETNQKLSAFGNGLQSYWHVKLALILFKSQIDKVEIIVRSNNLKSKQLISELTKKFPDVSFHLVLNENTNLKDSNVIFGCIPSNSPLIHKSQINGDKKVFISIIGSYKPDMFEVDDELVQSFKNSNHRIIIDSYEHTLSEAGELIKNGITEKNCIEIGQLDQVTDDEICNNGVTLCKIVGLSIMDVSIGAKLLDNSFAKEIGVSCDF